MQQKFSFQLKEEGNGKIKTTSAALRNNKDTFVPCLHCVAFSKDLLLLQNNQFSLGQ